MCFVYYLRKLIEKVAIKFHINNYHLQCHIVGGFRKPTFQERTETTKEALRNLTESSEYMKWREDRIKQDALENNLRRERGKIYQTRFAFTTAAVVLAIVMMMPFGHPSVLWKLVLINLAVCCDKPIHASISVSAVVVVMSILGCPDVTHIGFLSWSAVLAAKTFASELSISDKFIPIKELIAYEENDVDAIISGNYLVEEE